MTFNVTAAHSSYIQPTQQTPMPTKPARDKSKLPTVPGAPWHNVAVHGSCRSNIPR
jgi:hypothetical protein